MSLPYESTSAGAAWPGRRGAASPVRGRQRFEGTGEDVGRSLGRLVVTLLEVVRQVIERQALRRVDVGDLTEQQVEDLGRALIELEDTFDELRDTFGVREEDLFLPLDVRRLLDEPDTTRHRDHRRTDLSRGQSQRRETT
ncbi:MAG: gas vesicle protein K [Actinomycetota bacterium]|nr:gas vesicle protein K [Actinomycetota bacterium]